MNIEVQTDMQQNWWLSWFSGDIQNTRQRILLAAFREIHLCGYQAASIQNIIDQAGVTKGALYHHFASKHEMVLALIEEVYATYVETTFIQPMRESDDPVTTLVETLNAAQEKMSEQDVSLGCPLDSLAQEMAPIDPDIQHKVETLYQQKQLALIEAFRRGQAAGKIRQDISARSISLMFLATLQGCMGIAKSMRSIDALIQCGEGLIHYLEQLRVQPPDSAGESSPQA